MKNGNSREFWEACWQRGADTDYTPHIHSYYKKQDPIIDLFRRYRIHHVCDAACGYGAYSLLLASNGFLVEGFDIAPTSVDVTKAMLEKYGIDASLFKTASVLETGYDETFDAVTAISVLDHMCVSDAQNALEELLRIVKPGGIVVISFDPLDEEDLEESHETTDDGSILYTGGHHHSMVFHCYSEPELKTWLDAYNVVLAYTNNRGERFFAIQK